MRALADVNGVWIDLHPHLFNATDLPVARFIERADRPTGVPILDRSIGWLLGRLAKGAPDAEEDRAKIQDLIDVPCEQSFAPDPGAEPIDWFWRQMGRQARMITEARKSRLTMLCELNKMTQSGRAGAPIDLFVPLGVDLETGVDGVSPTPPSTQFELLELLSEATLRGRVPEVTGIVLPMVGFDPCREDGSERNSFERVQERVRSGRAIGVKLYPPMGFSPLGNGRDVEARLHRLYEWAASEHVPITAHCSPANAVRGAGQCARPAGWRPVLRMYDGLRLNVAHAGGLGSDGWASEAIELMLDHPTVYADVGNHDHGRQRVKAFVAELARLTQGSPNGDTVRRRLAFGTDYWFLFMHRDPAGFLHRYVDEVVLGLGADVLPRFAGGAAQEFLGFDVPDNQNRKRVLDRIVMLQRSGRGPFCLPLSLRRALRMTDAEVLSIESAG